MKASLGGKRLAIANFGGVISSWYRSLVLPAYTAHGLIKIKTIPLPACISRPSIRVEFRLDGRETLLHDELPPLTYFNSPSTDGLLFQFPLPSGPKVPCRYPSEAVTPVVPTAGLGALQYAPDGRIYIAQIGEQKLGVIETP